MGDIWEAQALVLRREKQRRTSTWPVVMLDGHAIEALHSPFVSTCTTKGTKKSDALPLRKKRLPLASRDGIDREVGGCEDLEQSHGARRRLFTCSPLVSALREAKHMKSERERALHKREGEKEEGILSRGSGGDVRIEQQRDSTGACNSTLSTLTLFGSSPSKHHDCVSKNNANVLTTREEMESEPLFQGDRKSANTAYTTGLGFTQTDKAMCLPLPHGLPSPVPNASNALMLLKEWKPSGDHDTKKLIRRGSRQKNKKRKRLDPVTVNIQRCRPRPKRSEREKRDPTTNKERTGAKERVVLPLNGCILGEFEALRALTSAYVLLSPTGPRNFVNTLSSKRFGVVGGVESKMAAQQREDKSGTTSAGKKDSEVKETTTSKATSKAS